MLHMSSYTSTYNTISAPDLVDPKMDSIKLDHFFLGQIRNKPIQNLIPVSLMP